MIRRLRTICRRCAAASALLLLATLVAGPALAQSELCVLSADRQHPNENVLRCGKSLTVRPAANTEYHLNQSSPDRMPESIQLDSGALLIEYHPGKERTGFQIQTPHAIAAVRGTKWALDVTPDETACLTLSGVVAVRGQSSTNTVTLRPGDGVDVTPGETMLVVKRWKPARVKALLARFR
jgi:hypothetical protein